ncbi:MAG: tetratricopeptide repeat protein [Scytonematopsis contorta HA4267-MV1]|jgi:tetratricopeptide (TPR) repeat protein|nr:tetratricopeptide repeat protein [Scytonematopsis contorta HA4267-MV1]
MLEDILAKLQQLKSVKDFSSIDATFEFNWKALEPEAKQLACLLSLFALAPIPWYLVELAVNACGLNFDMQANRDVLTKYYILQKVEENVYEIHENIKRILNNKLEELSFSAQLKRGFCQAIVAVAKTIDQRPTLQQILELSPAIPHIAEAATVYSHWLSDEDLICPFVANSRFYKGQGSYKQALFWLEQSLSVTQERLGEQHPDVANSLNNLALLYTSQGHYSEAETLYIKALDARKHLVGEQHLDVATSLNNLALLYHSQRRYSEAEPLYIKALDMRKRLLGEQHSDVATTLNNLAGLYKSQGCYSQAEPLYIQALGMKKRLLGEQHPDVATSLNNLAVLYKSQGCYSQAEPLYIQALDMRKRLLGEQHPDVATSLNNLALLYTSQGRYREAEPLCILALDIFEIKLGHNHPNTITCRENLASLRSTITSANVEEIIGFKD